MKSPLDNYILDVYKATMNVYCADRGIEKPFEEASPEMKQLAARGMEQAEAIMERVTA